MLAPSGHRADQPGGCSAAIDILTADVQMIVFSDIVVIHLWYLLVAHLIVSLFQVSHINKINEIEMKNLLAYLSILS